jgi:hypothetical protein
MDTATAAAAGHRWRARREFIAAPHNNTLSGAEISFTYAGETRSTIFCRTSQRFILGHLSIAVPSWPCWWLGGASTFTVGDRSWWRAGTRGVTGGKGDLSDLGGDQGISGVNARISLDFTSICTCVKTTPVQVSYADSR